MNVIDRWYMQVWAAMEDDGASDDLGLEEWLYVHPEYLQVNPPPIGVELPPLARSEIDGYPLVQSEQRGNPLMNMDMFFIRPNCSLEKDR